MSKSKTNEISTIYGTEKMTVTCIERRYKVENSKISFIVNAKKELDEDTTSKFLHEDMELKTFLANYEITDIKPQPIEIENNETVIRGGLIKNSLKTVIKHKARIGKTHAIIDIVENENKSPPKNMPKDEVDLSRDTTRHIIRTPVKNVPKIQERNREAWKRRQLFDTIVLPEKFRARDYAEAIEEKGIKITNDAMPYDDLNWLEEQGKIVRIDKEKRGQRFYKLAKKNDQENNTEEIANIRNQ